MNKSKATILILIISNVVTLFVLSIVSFHYQVPQKVLGRFGISIPKIASLDYKYTENYKYDARRSLFRVYNPNKINIVMLGNSITYGVDWNELLMRTDIANRGIEYDVTEGFINRLEDICSLKPKFCFIMGGINDFRKGLATDDIFKNYTILIKNLKENNIIPVIQSTLYVSSKRHNWKSTNHKVDELNAMLKDYAKKEGIIFIDVNNELSQEKCLNSMFTYDGVHLLGNGYAKWRDLILPIIHHEH